MAQGSRAVELLRVGLEQVQQRPISHPPGQLLYCPVGSCAEVREERSRSLGLGRNRQENRGARFEGGGKVVPALPPFIGGRHWGWGCRAVSWSLGTSAKASVVGEPSGAIPHGVQCILVSLAAPCLKCQKGGGVFLAQLLWCGCTPGARACLHTRPSMPAYALEPLCPCQVSIKSVLEQHWSSLEPACCLQPSRPYLAGRACASSTISAVPAQLSSLSSLFTLWHRAGASSCLLYPWRNSSSLYLHVSVWTCVRVPVFPGTGVWSR